MCLKEKYNNSWLEVGIGKPEDVEEHNPPPMCIQRRVQTPTHPALRGGTVSGLQAERSQK